MTAETTTANQSAISAQLQRCAVDVAGQLAQVVKTNPDLQTYLQSHAQCIAQALGPRGYSYEMQSGLALQSVLSHNITDLGYVAMPEQEHSFRAAMLKVAQTGSPLVLNPHTMPSDGLHGLQVADSPSPERLPMFNHTAYEQIFVPIIFGKRVVGVLQAWFPQKDTGTTKVRAHLLTVICSEIELYLKARRVSDISQELTRLTTYTHLLEELSGEIDLESVSWNVVNYARETLSCERVTLFVDKSYSRPTRKKKVTDYDLVACSGLRRPNARSEQARVLRDMARKLVTTSLARQRQRQVAPPEIAPVAPTAEAPAQVIETPSASRPLTPSRLPGSTAAAPAEAEARATRVEVAPVTTPTPREIEEEEVLEAEAKSLLGESQAASPAVDEDEQEAIPHLPATQRPQFALMLAERDPEKVASRPADINLYFDLVPMNWACAIPLYDRANVLCGMMLFEGRNKAPEATQALTIQMGDLALSAGRAVGTAVYWDRRASISMARRFESLRDTLLQTPKKVFFWSYALPLIAAAMIMFMPTPFKISGAATLRPVNFASIPSMISARVVEVAVKEGQMVQKGDVLFRLDTDDLRLQYRQCLQEYERLMLEADSAGSNGNDQQMISLRLQAQKSLATGDKIKSDIGRATVTAPMTGVIIGPPNLGLRQGQIVKEGEPLAEIADPKAWEAKVDISEADVVALEKKLAEKPEGIEGTIKLSADATKTINVKITDIGQLSHGVETGRNSYLFSAVMPIADDQIDPATFKLGFSGQASFNAGHEPVYHYLFNDFYTFLRVHFQ